MFDPKSRYNNVSIATIDVTEGDGTTRQVRYVQRRIIPSNQDMTTVTEHTVTQGDRLDNITYYYLGDPLQFWRVCDANNVLSPNELTDTIGRVIKIVLPNL